MPKKEVRDYNTNLPNEGEYEKLPSRDAADYVLVDVEDSPIPGHQVQVYHAEAPQAKPDE